MSAEVSWFKLDDAAVQRLRRGPVGSIEFYVCALSHLSHYLLGDVLLEDDVEQVGITAKVKRPVVVLEGLAELGFAEPTPDGWRMLQRPEIGEWARTHADVERMREAKAAAGRASARARREAKAAREAVERQQAVDQAVRARTQQAVQHPVQHPVQHDVEQVPQQTRDGSLSTTSRETSRNDEVAPVDKDAARDGVAAARSLLRAVPDFPVGNQEATS